VLFRSAGRDKVRGKGSSASRDKADDDDDEDADAGKSKSHGEGSSAGRDRAGDVDDKAGGGLTSGKPGGSLTSGKPVVFPARVFTTRVNYKDMVYKGGAEIDDKLNMELRPNFHTAPFSATLFADLPRLAQLAVLSLGWNAINWDADSFKPKIDYSSTGTVIMSSEMRELIKMSYPNLKEDEGRLLHAYLIKRV
jgi:hypothetical protein